MGAAANSNASDADDAAGNDDAAQPQQAVDVAAEAAEASADEAAMPEVMAAEEVVAADDPAHIQAELAQLRHDSAQMRKGWDDLEKRAADATEKTRFYAQQYDKARQEYAAVTERLKREQERAIKRELTKAVTGLLGVLDTFDTSVNSVKGGAAIGPSFVEGLQMIQTQFGQALAAMGLTRFDGVGEPFDPNRHQAVTTMNVLDPAQDNVVVHSVSAGAVLGDEVVRPATVVVGKCLAVGSEAVS